MSIAITPIQPVDQFSVASDMAANNDVEVNFQGVAQAFAEASANSKNELSEMMKIVGADGVTVSDMSNFQIKMGEWKIKEQLVTHLASEATKGFKTLTQQS